MTGGGIKRALTAGVAATSAWAVVAAATATAGLIPLPEFYETDSRPFAVAAGKVNAGPTKDIVVAHRDGRSFSVLPGDGNGEFGDAVTYDLSDEGQGIAIAKVDGDNRPDVVVTVNDTSAGDVLEVHRGRPDGFKPVKTYPLPTDRAQDLAIADLNKDGKLDAVVGDTQGSAVVVKYGKGDGAFGPAKQFAFRFPAPDQSEDTEPQWVEVGDFDRDGFKDIAAAVGRRSDLGVLYTKTVRRNGKLRAAKGKFRKRSYDTAGLPYGLAIGDLNRDGRLDAALPNDYGGNLESISVFFGKGKGRRAGFRPQQEIDIGKEPFGGIAIGRFDAGPRPDIAVSASDNDLVYLYGGPDEFSAPFDFGLVEGAISLDSAKLNGDPDDDVIVPDWNGGGIWVVLEED